MNEFYVNKLYKDDFYFIMVRGYYFFDIIYFILCLI